MSTVTVAVGSVPSTTVYSALPASTTATEVSLNVTLRVSLSSTLTVTDTFLKVTSSSLSSASVISCRVREGHYLIHSIEVFGRRYTDAP